VRAADSARAVHLCACSQARIFAHKWPAHALRLTQALTRKVDDLKSTLKKLLAAFCLLGIVLLAYPFISSLAPNEKSDNEATLTIRVSDMVAGDVKQIENAYFLYKQSNNEYLLMNGWAPYRGCPIFHIKKGEGKYTWGERKDYNNKDHFYDRCDGTIWEMNGKLVKNTAYHKERDMEHRNFDQSNDGYILFHRGKS